MTDELTKSVSRGADHVHDHTELDDTESGTPIVQEETRIPVKNDIEVEVVGGTIDQAEKAAYTAYAKQKHGSALKKLVVNVDGDNVILEYHLVKEGFQRIRRVTGYLTGTLDRWNSAKRAEEHDRVKHGMNGLAHEHTLEQIQ